MTKTRYLTFSYLALRDGEKCKSCGETGKELVIDHIDTNSKNDNLANLRLLCRSCNRKNLIELHPQIKESERENIHAEAAHEDKPATLKIAEDKEPLYISWLYENVDREHGLTFWDCLYEGSDRVGISPITARRYLLKKLATTFELGPGPRGHKLIRWRKDS